MAPVKQRADQLLPLSDRADPVQVQSCARADQFVERGEKRGEVRGTEPGEPCIVEIAVERVVDTPHETAQARGLARAAHTGEEQGAAGTQCGRGENIAGDNDARRDGRTGRTESGGKCML